MGLMADLGHGPVGVDTAIFIYFIEERPQFLPLVEPLFREADEGHRELITSALTLLEVLVVPYRSGDHLLALRSSSHARSWSPDRRHFAGSFARGRAAQGCDGTQDSGLSSACGGISGRLHQLSHE